MSFMGHGQGIIIYTGEPLAIGYSPRCPVKKREHSTKQNRETK